MPKINRYWNSDPASLVEPKPIETYELCKVCEIVRILELKESYQKYKRCLTMAAYWVAVSYQCVDDNHKQRAEKRHKKWLKLAIEFKREYENGRR